jgi:uncharacterized membrane protein
MFTFPIFTKIRYYWLLVRESLWFVPSTCVLAAIVMAFGFTVLDRHSSYDGTKFSPLLFGVGAEGSRGMLTAIAGSMLTVAALVFTLTLSTIAAVSSQYSPRVLRNFMRDPGNQFVLGYFLGVYVYCLIVLGTIRSTEDNKFVPSTSVLVGLLLALGGVTALIYFFHHIAESMQTGTILEQISQDVRQAIDQMFPEDLSEPAGEPPEAEMAKFTARDGWHPIYASGAGYVQTVNAVELLDWASQNGMLLRIEQHVGAFVAERTCVINVRSEGMIAREHTSDILKDLPGQVVITRHRTIEQDVAFGLQQLVDICLRGLSTGVNDTTTTLMAIDYIGLLCQRLAGRAFPSRLRSDGLRPRVLVQALDFAAYVKLAFDSVRISAKGNHAVFARLLRVLALCTETALGPDRRTVLRSQVNLVMSYAEQTLATDYEKECVRDVYKEVEEDRWTA